jgi:alkanesulfonate monooxygenase SsuD/methylene tetrahydromethanopterin reductase-like flavin-dependent oxidoreductase (luciferase family)
VELGPLVACTSFHNPAMIAKKASTIDEISGGRLVLGLGAGWNDAEYRAFGFPTDHRVSRFEEAFTVIRTLLSDGFIDFHGNYYTADNCHLLPRGPRPGGPPLMVGSFGERMLRITAPYVHAWNAWYVDFENDPQQLAPLMAKVDDACREAGRDPASVERTCAVLVEATGSAGRPSSSSGTVVPGKRGSAAEVADWLRAYATAGISHVQVVLDPNTLEAIEEFAPVLAELDRGA